MSEGVRSIYARGPYRKLPFLFDHHQTLLPQSAIHKGKPVGQVGTRKSMPATVSRHEIAVNG